MEYKRLTKGLIESTEKGRMIVACNYEDTDCNDSCLYGGYKCRWVEKALYRLAELEDKIEQGTLIELPCKVGDTAYCANYGDKGWRILKGYVNEINIDVNGIYIKCDYEYSLSFWHKPILGDVFFNIEDAKKHLKELKELQ